MRVLRVIGWVAFAALLVAAGAVLHELLPPAERWVARGVGGVMVFRPEHGRLLTWGPAGEPKDNLVTFRLLDPRTGAVLGEFLAGRSVYDFPARRNERTWNERQFASPDGRYVGLRLRDVRPKEPGDGGTGDFGFRLLDLETRQARALDGDVFAPVFSQAGDVVAFTLNNRTIRLERLPAGEVLARLPAGGLGVGFSGFTSDGRFFVYEASDQQELGVRVLNVARPADPPRLVAKGTTGQFALQPGGTRLLAFRQAKGAREATLWDVETGRLLGSYGLGRQEDLLHFSGDGRYLLRPRPEADGPVETVEIATGRVTRLPAVEATEVEVVAGGKVLILRTSRIPLPVRLRFGERLEAFDVRSAVRLWVHDTGAEPGGWSARASFSADGCTVLAVDEPPVCLDVATGRRLPLDETFEYWQGLRFAGNHLLYVVPSGHHPNPPRRRLRELLKRVGFKLSDQMVGLVKVFDPGSGNCLLHLDAVPVQEAWLSEDGATLLTLERESDDTLLRCYDVPARRPWRWIAGFPASVAVLWISLLALWQRRRKDKEVSA